MKPNINKVSENVSAVLTSKDGKKRSIKKGNWLQNLIGRWKRK